MERMVLEAWKRPVAEIASTTGFSEKEKENAGHNRVNEKGSYYRQQRCR